MKARVDEAKRIVLDDPAASDLKTGDRIEIDWTKIPAPRHRPVEGLWEGVDLSEEDIDEMRRELFASLDDDRD